MLQNKPLQEKRKVPVAFCGAGIFIWQKFIHKIYTQKQEVTDYDKVL